MNLKVPNEGLSFFFMTAGIMNPMMVMRILDWVSDCAATRQHYWPTTDLKSPKKYVGQPVLADQIALGSVLAREFFLMVQLMDCKSEHIPKLRGADGLYRSD